MVKKISFYGFVIFKTGIWISAISVLLVSLTILFFITFPKLFETYVGDGISKLTNLPIKLSTISIDLEQKKLILKVSKIKIANTTTINDFRWHINILNIFNSYNTGSISIDSLKINYKGTKNDNIKPLLTKYNIGNINFIQSLSINKTIINNNAEVFIIEPIFIKLNNAQVSLKILNQSLNFNKFSTHKTATFDIFTTFLISEFYKNNSLTLPLTISTDNFLLKSNLRFFNKNNNNFVEFDADIDSIKATDVTYYMPIWLLSPKTRTWLNTAFKSGQFNNIKLNISKNLSTKTPPKIKLTTHLKDAEFLFSNKLKPIKHLNADINIDGKKLVAYANNAKLNNLDFANIKLEIADIKSKKASINIDCEIQTNSTELIKFLSNSFVATDIQKTLKNIILTGKLNGNINIVIPLYKNKPKISANLTVTDNILTVLNGTTVNNFNSKITYSNGKITTKGTGNINNIPFAISINPKNNNVIEDTLLGIELFNKNNNLKINIKKQPDKLWFVGIKSDNINGNLSVLLEKNQIPEIIINDLKISKSKSTKQRKWNISPKDVPSMYLQTKNIYINAYKLPNAKAYINSTNNEIIINELQFEDIGIKDSELVISGSWVDGKTSFVAMAKVEKLSDLLTKLNIKEEIKGNNFNFNISLFCDCAPWDVNFNNIYGLVKMNIKNGTFVGKSSSITEIIELLNMRSIAKIISFNEQKLTSKDFSYDDIEIESYIEKSFAKVKKFNITSKNSNIKLEGSSNLIDKTYDLKARVQLNIADSIPLVAYLTGQGLAGLGLWLADKALFSGTILDNFTDKMLNIKYNVTGPWNKPIIAVDND